MPVRAGSATAEARSIAEVRGKSSRGSTAGERAAGEAVLVVWKIKLVDLGVDNYVRRGVPRIPPFD